MAAGGAMALAVDIGGTKMASGLVDEQGTLLDHHQVATPPGGDAEQLFAALSSVIAQVDGADQAIVCGVGSGGPMTGFGAGVSPVNIPGWRGFPLRERVATLTGLPTYVDNDAKALALAEGWRGAAQGHADFIGMVVSTGVGGGIVLGGQLLDGADGNAGHIGHIIVEPEGRPCACGARGCLEAEASGSAIATVTGRPPADAPEEVRVRTGRLVGRAVASVASLLDLQLAVVAGSVAIGYGDVFFDAAQAEIERSARLEFSRGTRIRPAGLLAGAPLIGAAAVGWRGTGRSLR